SVTGAAYDYANPTNTNGSVAFGLVHVGTAASQTVGIGNATITNAAYQDLLDVSATANNGNLSVTGFTGLVASAGGSTTQNVIVAFASTAVGSLNDAVTLNLVSNANS